MSDAGTTGGALAEVRKVRATAEKLADGNYPTEADQIRALAGMIRQLAEQVERLAAEAPSMDGPSRGTTPAGVLETVRHEAGEPGDDRSAERGPAAPIADRVD